VHLWSPHPSLATLTVIYFDNFVSRILLHAMAASFYSLVTGAPN
jgi:hypothetical protein